MSEARAITNFIGNGVATIWIANNEKEFDRSKMDFVFGNLSEIKSQKQAEGSGDSLGSISSGRVKF
jgi:Na+/H+-dicarboxylate symporter